MARRVYRGKLVVAGDPAVGKTAVCQMFSKDGSEFPKNYNMTFGPEIYTKTVPIPNSEDSVELIIYDSPSFELYTDLLGDFWKNPDLLMMVYDVTSPKSLETIPIWFEMCRQVDWRGRNGSPVASVLLGNKSDLEHRRKVQEPQGLSMAERFNSSYEPEFYDCPTTVIATPASRKFWRLVISIQKNNQGLEDPFRYLANSYYQHRVNEEKGNNYS